MSLRTAACALEPQLLNSDASSRFPASAYHTVKAGSMRLTTTSGQKCNMTCDKLRTWSSVLLSLQGRQVGLQVLALHDGEGRSLAHNSHSCVLGIQLVLCHTRAQGLQAVAESLALHALKYDW